MTRTVLVTGGSSGIGAATVRAFASQGDQVIFTYRSGADRAQALVAEVSAAGGSALALPFDQGDLDSQEALLAQLPAPVDVLINNAGLGSKTVDSYADTPASQDRALLQVNAVGVLWLTQAIVPGMVERGFGKVVSVASVGGGVTQFPSFRLADGMSKAAVAFMGRQLAAEFAKTPVDVFTVCPGATDTAMFAASSLDGLDPAQRVAFEAGLPKGRLIEPGEIAEVIRFLCSDAARVLHGAVIDASMGLGVHPGLITGGTA
ncbi:SDR family NAD(P)-dependent oxidoreductase [Luteipulveratus mongoliensis]|uniref:Ketoreductase domain-containing protein n=1 Tax=Luteipulveratus mongoliensis TaxID=571913 RepID=A0A0K1JGH9_9MICO|nr:SDR family oxidoreductase [Luteipulveratus mongoliensis]AKU15814.1 hypothetical protein VV02_08015 [Luteipulveratus mongoliensis]